MEELEFNDYNMGKKQTTVELPIKVWMDAKKNFIEFKEAMEFGVKFKLADKDGGLTFDYPETNLQAKLLKKCQMLQKDLQEANARVESFLNPIPTKEPEKEFDDALKEIGIK